MPDVSQGQQRATIYDVARRAGVSHQTVSRLLQGFEGIRPQTRAKVEAALRELNYRPNMTARSLATSSSHRIGALAYEMFEVGPSKIMQGASAGAREAGYLLDIVSLDPSDGDAIDMAIRLLDQHDLAGIIASAPTQRVRDALQDVPFTVPIYIEGEAEDPAFAGLQSLNGRGTTLLIDHLVELGHRRFAYISGPSEWFAARSGFDSFRSALRSHGLEATGVLEGDWSAKSGYAAVDRITSFEGVTAVVAANDQMALGVLRGLAERGIRVPEDVSVVGFDDIPESEFFLPPLTTIRVDFDAQGHYAIAQLLSKIDGREAPVRDEYMRVELLARESSAGAAAGMPGAR